MGQPIGVCRWAARAQGALFTVYRPPFSVLSGGAVVPPGCRNGRRWTVDGKLRGIDTSRLKLYLVHRLRTRVSGDSRLNRRSTTWDELSESTSERPTR
jgi:hypothetical protein